jgi:hypothetical protein
MPVNTYLEQSQIGSKTADLHMSGPSARERGPSRPATAGPIFNEVPRHAPEPPHMTWNLNYLVGSSAYNDGRFAHNHGRSEPMSRQSAHDLFEEDCYLNPHPSQQHFPSHYCHTRVSGHQDPGANIITRCAGTKSHTYDESWHRIECHNFTT